MKIDLQNINTVKKRMTVEVPPDLVEKERDSVLRGYAAKASVPGFRPGKAPLSVINARFAKQVREDVRERVLSRAYAEAAKEKGLRPIADPVLDEVNDKEGEPFTFKTTFEVLPDFEVKNYKEIEVRERKVVVGEEDVKKMLEELQQSRVQLVTEEGRTAATGDVIVADIAGTPEGGEAFNRERMMIELGATDIAVAFRRRCRENQNLFRRKTQGCAMDYP